MKLVEGKFGRKACTDLLDRLDAIREGVKEGRIVEFVCAYVEDNEYSTVVGASIKDSLVLATILKMNVEDQFKVK